MTDTSAFEDMERDGWANAAIASAYAERFSNATTLVAEHLCDAIDVAENQKVLDLCSGHGVVAGKLVSRGAHVTGLDFSPAMVKLAEHAVPEAEFLQGDAMDLPFENNSFDAVTIGFGVPHFPDPRQGLGEAARVLKPKGRLAFSIWQGSGSAGAFGWLFEAFDTHGDQSVTLPPGPDAHAFAQADTAAPVLADLGFVDVTLSVARAYLHISAPEELFDVFDTGAVRAVKLLSPQSPDARANMRAAMADKVKHHAIRTPDGWHVPAPVVVVSAILV